MCTVPATPKTSYFAFNTWPPSSAYSLKLCAAFRLSTCCVAKAIKVPPL